jgi:hypothetical protein
MWLQALLLAAAGGVAVRALVTAPAAQPSERAAPAGAGRDAPTRLLSAAAHLQPRFAQQAVAEILHQPHRALAPSFGVALGDVLRHCVASHGRRRARSFMLTGLLALLVFAAFELLRAVVTDFEKPVPLILFVPLLAAWAVTFAELWTSRYRVARQPGSAIEYLSPGAEAVVRELEAREPGNLVVYSGYRPWAGAGQIHGGWTFAVNVRKGREDAVGRREPRDFTADELHDYVSAHVRATVPRLQLEDRLYVDGQHVRDDRRFLADRFGHPRTCLSDAEFAAAAAAGPPEVVRRYRSMHLTAWSGEVTFSVFLAFHRTGTSLYADATYCALLPPATREGDEIDPWPPLSERTRLVGEALGELLRSVKPRRPRLRSRLAERRAIARNRRFDYGAVASLRELAQAPHYRRYFQWLDRDMAAKIVEREVIDAIVAFLDEHDIDSTDLRARRTALLNNGVIVTGGELSTQSLAVGHQAQSTAVTS